MEEETKGKEVKITLESKKSLLPLIAIVIVIAIIGSVLGKNFINGKNKAPEILTKSTLEKIINISELSTFQAVYNGIAQVNDEKKPEKVDYYVAYDATVHAGIDFSKVEIALDDTQKKITVTLPEIEITDVNVDIASFDYMFEDKDTNKSGISEQAYKACIYDVTEESKGENAIYELAEQNAKNIIRALITPFIEQLDSEYVLEVR